MPVTPPARIRVLVVDDSALIREAVRRILSADPVVEVVGVAANGHVALGMVRRLRPEVITLDVAMPHVDGLVFLETLMSECPTPVVMLSGATEAGAPTTLRALELGALDFALKPTGGLGAGAEFAEELIEKVKAVASARLPARRATGRPAPAPRGPLGARSRRVIVVGASTGGPEALRELLTALPPDCSGLVIVQHMPERFTRAFAARLDSVCGLRVKEAEPGDRVVPGQALIAPGGRHARLAREGAEYHVRLSADPPVNGHRPAVDELFVSCAEVAGADAVGVLMTGMGSDGARGLLAMRRAGARTIAQDQATSVVFGMPRAALELGAVETEAPLERLADGVIAALQPRSHADSRRA